MLTLLVYTSILLGDTTALRVRLDSIAASVTGAEVAVAYVDFATRDSLYRNADVVFHAASTMKIPVMMEVLRSAEEGRLRLDQEVLLVNQFASIVDRSAYALDPTEDGDTSLYAFTGQRVSVRELMRRMIVRSSNLATNTLIELVGAAQVRAMAQWLGAVNANVLRGVEDQKAFDAGMNNTITARDLAILLSAVESGKAVSPRAAVLMREILAAQEFREKIPAGLPPGTRVAHKTGEITAVSHDAAIVYPPRRAPYVIVVLTRGIRDGAVSARLISDISRSVWEHATGN
jgi:beta-lactamase class A